MNHLLILTLRENDDFRALPRAPNDYIIEKFESLGTFPILDCQIEAIELATTPFLENPAPFLSHEIVEAFLLKGFSWLEPK